MTGSLVRIAIRISYVVLLIFSLLLLDVIQETNVRSQSPFLQKIKNKELS
jgi:hypothetical protein